MATAYTSLLGLALPVTGELQGTWGTVVNDEITSLLDTSIAGATVLSTDTDVTLSTTTGLANQARQAIILWTANGTVTRNITAPARSKVYVVINASAGTQSIVIRGVGPTTGVTIAKGERALVAWNGSDFVRISAYGGTGEFTTVDTTNLEVTNIKAKDGTASATIADSTGALTVSADFAANSNSTFGDVVGDVVTINGTTTFVNAAPTLTPLTASQAVFTNGSKTLVSNAITGTGNVVMSASPTLTGTVAGASLQLSSLTSGRVTYAGASGLLQDNSSFTFDGTTLAAPTLDSTNLEVTNLKAKDGTSAGSIADATGVVTLASSILTTTDINGGTIDGTTIGTSVRAAGNFTTLDSNGNTTLGDTSGDTLQVNASVASNLLFIDNTYDIGASGATRPRNLFLANNAVVGGTVNGLTITSTTGTLTVANGKTATFNNTLAFSGTDSTVMTFPSASTTVVGTDSTQTLTNKRYTPRVGTVASAATITPTGDSSDLYTVTALATNATIAAPSGTPTDGQRLMLRILDNGTSRGLTWTTTAGGYRGVLTSLPTSTQPGLVLYVGCIYNSQAGYWDVVALVQQ
jgi:hypothetical protein